MAVWMALLFFVASMLDGLHCQWIEAEDSLTLTSEGSGQSSDMEQPWNDSWLLTSSDHPLKSSQQHRQLPPHAPVLIPDVTAQDQLTTPKVAVDQSSVAAFGAGHPSDVHAPASDHTAIRIPQPYSSAGQPTDEMEAAVVRLCAVLGQCPAEILENDMMHTTVVQIEQLSSEPTKTDSEHFIYPPAYKSHVATDVETSSLPSLPIKSDQLTDNKDMDLSKWKTVPSAPLDTDAKGHEFVSDDDTTEPSSSVKTTRSNVASSIYNRYHRTNNNPIVRMPAAINTQRPKLAEADRSHRRLPSPKMPALRRNFTELRQPADNSTSDPRISYSSSYVQVSGVTISDSQGRPTTEPTAKATKAASLTGPANFEQVLKNAQYSYHESPVLTSGYANVKLNH